MASLIVRIRRLREAGALVTRIKRDGLILMAERKILCDAIGIGVVHLLGGAKTAAAFGVFGREQMAFAGAGAHDFAGAGDLEPFRDRLLRFDTFGASHKFKFVTKEREL